MTGTGSRRGAGRVVTELCGLVERLCEGQSQCVLRGRTPLTGVVSLDTLTVHRAHFAA